MPFLVHMVFPIVVICAVYKEMAGSNPFGSIVYDVTNPLQEMLEKGSYLLCNNTLENSNMQISPHVFYKVAFENYFALPNNIAQYFVGPLAYELKQPEVDLIFAKNYTCSLDGFLKDQKIDHFPAAILFKELGGEASCEHYNNIIVFYKINDTLPARSRIKFGFELNEEWWDCIMERYPTLLGRPDIIVFNIDIDTMITELSYGIFSKRMTKIMNEKATFLREINPDGEFYIRLSMKEYSFDILGQADAYRAIYAKYAETWIKGGGKGKFIVDTFPKTVVYKPTEKVKLENTYLMITDRYISYTDPCELPKLIETGLGHFKNVVLDFGSHNSIVDIISQCQNKYTNSTKFNSIGRTFGNLSLRILPVFNIEKLVNTIEILDNYFSIETVFTELLINNSTESDSLYKFAISRNISLGCIESVLKRQYSNGTIELYNPRRCERFQASHFPHRSWAWNAANVNNSMEDMQFIFDISLEFWKNFTQENPNRKFLINLPVSNPVGGNALHPFRSNIYCSQNLQDVKEVQDAVATWAAIHNFGVISQPLLDTGWWYNLVSEDNLNRSNTLFPVMVRRNLPDVVEEMSQLPYSYPCIHRTENVDTEISFEHNGFSGISINLKMKNAATATIREIQTFLLFAFGKFASVEIMASSDTQIEEISKALTRNLNDVLKPRQKEVEKLNLYIGCDNPETLHRYLSILSNSELIIIGLHLRGWENHGGKINEGLLGSLRKHFDGNSNKIGFGITVQNCVEEINSGLSRFKSLGYFLFVKYIVCVVKPVTVDNSNRTAVQLYFDTHFYIQQYFREVLNVETMFRLDFIQPLNKSESIENYLKFLNDTNQHAEGYRVKYFMGNGITNTLDNLLSWWTIDDNKDLANGSAYTELESDYHGRQTEQRFRLNAIPDEIEDKNNNILLVIIIATISLILLTTLLYGWYYHQSKLSAVLTTEEVKAFRYGEEIETVKEKVGIQYIKIHTTKTLGFDERLEISNKNLELDDVIGQGNFGIVYSGLLNGAVKVAIKIPHTDCTKEAFKTILAEVKILCYLGCHPNVLSFLGAHTKNIERGIIYVITEFCSNGSLQNHLNNMAQKPDAPPCFDCSDIGYVYTVDMPDDVDDVDQSDLYRFSYEIACGMEYIASQKVVHADLSTRNVLLTADMTCKIGDFGLSRKLYERNEYTKKSNEAMAWRWMAIESLNKMEFTTKSDVWSYGITLWEIFSLGDTPYPGLSCNRDFLEELHKGFRMNKPFYTCDNIYVELLEGFTGRATHIFRAMQKSSKCFSSLIESVILQKFYVV